MLREIPLQGKGVEQEKQTLQVLQVLRQPLFKEEMSSIDH